MAVKNALKSRRTWEQRKLGDVFEEYTEKGHPELPALTIIQGGGTVRRDESDRNLQYDKASLSSYKMVKAEDFIVHLRSFEGGLEKATTLGIISPAYHTFHGEGTDSRFYYAYFRSHQFINKDLKPHVYGIRDGRSIDIDGMKTIDIPYTDVNEQKAIGDFIEGLDRLITLHQRKILFISTMKRGVFAMAFSKESDFELAVIQALQERGWKDGLIKNPTEADLIQNWAEILFENNRGIDRLNDFPLTDGEMAQVVEQVKALRTPLKLNSFINGKTVTIKRDNPEDTSHLGKEVSLKIYDRREIAAGQSRYQIAQQPKFPTASKMLNDRRGDVMLLINGMPVIHIELKKSGIPVSQAYHQIEKYAAEGIFTGLFSLIQIFVAMNPEETVYFANPGPDGKFNTDFYFHWADFNNEPVNDWKQVITRLLSIPMAHMLIGFYTVADQSDGVLKVMRSYQYYAASAISDRVAKAKWEGKEQLGGYIWHTTGSGKTMTSFKSAQLIASSKDADKVIFLVDRIELGTQSLREYRGFAGENEDVQATENTGALVGKLKSSNPSDTLIVTSIQKMSNIKDEADGGLKAADLELMKSKRIVFIVDECHRDTFGDMMLTIKETFPRAMFFGFTGTPILDENGKKDSTTATVFGNELHRYSIADGIRDKNVLGFDPYKVLVYKDKDLRTAVAVDKAKAKDEKEARSDPEKAKVYYHYMALPMAGHRDENGKYIRGIEDLVPQSQYATEEFRNKVVDDILENWDDLSRDGKFHAIFATSSIPDAIDYYGIFKARGTALKITALFDPNIDNNGGAVFKEEGLKEIIEDYNARYGQDFTIPTFAKMKKDISARLAHKNPYQRIVNEPEKQIDLLIVVNQMLTGFDSKWLNTLYLDKEIQYQDIIQAFSRTNRLFGAEKPFGTIKYYRRPHTMEKNIEGAVRLYSGNRPLGLFVDRLPKNLTDMNAVFSQIKALFQSCGDPDFKAPPKDMADRGHFAKLWRQLNESLEAAKVQGFRWSKREYNGEDKAGVIAVELDERTYQILARRYKEMFELGSGGDDPGDDLPYEVDPYLTTIDTGKIDSDYMNSRFEKYLKKLNEGAEDLQAAEDELHSTFATLTQEEQRYAELFLHDIQQGNVQAQPGKTLRDYITEYMENAKNDQIHRLAILLGLDESMLRNMMALHITEDNINEYGRFDALKGTMDISKAKAYFESKEGHTIIPPMVHPKADKLLRSFILNGGYDIDLPSKAE